MSRVLTYNQEKRFEELVVTTSVDTYAAIDWIGDNMQPDDVFSYDQLAKWAVDNGFIKAVGL